MSGTVRPITALAALALLTLAPTEASSQAQPTTYPLTCNLQDALQFWVRDDGFRLVFRGAPQGYATKAPDPGQCAWQDRGWRADEGSIAVLEWQAQAKLVYAVVTDSERRIDSVLVNPRANAGDRELLQKVFQAWKTQGGMRVQAYRTGNIFQVAELEAIRTTRSRNR